jgi:hypothetical protein
MPENTTIEIKEGTTSIAGGAFTNCVNLVSIRIPSSVTSIGNNAFYYCSGLKAIVIPGSVKSINNYTFYKCSALTSVKVSDGVTSIGDYAFFGCFSLNSLNIPNSVTTIGNYAFDGCSGLTSVTIGSGVAQFGDYAFAYCTNLASLEIKDGVTSIGNYTFQSCSSLSSINLPNSLISIGIKAFDGCAWIANLPDGVVYAGKVAYCYKGTMSDYTNITLKEGTLGIATSAFRSYTLLSSVTLPGSLVNIGPSAFYDCSNLTSVIALMEVPMPIDNSMFNYRNFATLHVPAGYKDVYEAADYWKEFKEIVEMPGPSPTIEFADANVKALCIANWDTDDDGELSEAEAAAVTNLRNVFKEKQIITSFNELQYFTGLTSIQEGAFYGCSNLSSVTIPNSVTSIGGAAFQRCFSLTNIIVPSTVTSIGSWAFNDSGLSSVIISNGVTSIGEYAFHGTHLQSLTIPSSVNNIGVAAFGYCLELSSITVESGNEKYYSNDCNAIIERESNTLIAGCINTKIPFGVEEIANIAFRGCKMTAIEIPSSVTAIGAYAFNWCDKLVSVTIPSSVSSIGEWAFYGCDCLSSVKVEMETPIIIEQATFSNCANAILYVPYGCKAAYEAADYWKEFKEIVEFPEQTDKETLSVDDVKVWIGSTVEMAISLTNESEDLTAYQFDLILPDGISLSVNDKGKYVVYKTSRYEDDSQTLNVSKLEGSENAYRFVCFSMSNGVITGKSGAILNAVLAIGESVNEGSYEAKIKNIIVTKTDGAQLKLNDAKFNIVVSNVILGDANGDGNVNVTDIVEIVNYIMEKPSDRFVAAAADLNGDGYINVTDIVKVVSIIMSANTNAPKRVSAMEMIDNEQLTLDVNDRVYSLHLDNEAQYVASQFEIRLGDGQTLEGVLLNGERSDGHQVTYTQTGNNLYKVVVFSTENHPFNCNNGELLSFKVSGNGNVEVSNILFVTSGETEKLFPSLYAGMTGIDVIKTADTMDVYSIDGRLVRRQVTNTNSLEKGMYIINGKKTIVK